MASTISISDLKIALDFYRELIHAKEATISNGGLRAMRGGSQYDNPLAASDLYELGTLWNEWAALRSLLEQRCREVGHAVLDLSIAGRPHS